VRVSVLVPYRQESPERARIWDFLRSCYERRFPAWEIVTAQGPEGPFCRTGALGDAAQQARGDIFVCVDADVWCEGLDEAVQKVAAGATWVDPAAEHVVRLTEAATAEVLAGGAFPAAGSSAPGHRRVACGGIVALSRAAFLRCPPDRRFVGWGAEDHAWAADLARAYGPATSGVRAPLYHLWHPPNQRVLSPQNRRLLEEHLACGTKRRVHILADVPTWAWAKKAQALKACLSGRFDISILYATDPTTGPLIAGKRYDLLHTFEVYQASGLPAVPHTTGITAHVWSTWENRHGAGTVRTWAARARGIHANSRLLQTEMQEYLGRSVWYVPNGVDEQVFHRTRPREAHKLVVGFVGKDNPRKGYDIVRAACAQAGVELREVRRHHSNALSSEAMREFYQDIHVLAVASDMDGTPNPALEAAACECAVVSTSIGNMPEFIEPGVNGLLVKRSVDSLTAALVELAGRPLEQVEAMGRAARATIEQGWTWQIQAEHYAEMWTACIERGTE
jgi:glycosyltransferase involved in cell wall biosynthesis